MRRLVDADIDAAHIFADEPEQEHDHAAHEQQSGEYAGVAYGNFGIEEFLVNDVEACDKADEGANNADEGSGTQRLDGECGKAVNPEPDKTCECVAGGSFDAVTVLYFYIAEVLGGAENETANVGEWVGIAHNFINNELAHNKEACGAERLGLPNDSFGHFLVNPGTKAAEQVLP